jgi:hypothetical protein
VGGWRQRVLGCHGAIVMAEDPVPVTTSGY